MNLESPVESISRITSIYAKRLHKLGIKTVRDLIYHFPFRYEDLSRIAKISEIKVNETVTVYGEIINIKTIRTFKKKMWLTEALIKDDSGTIRAVWYNQPYLTKNLKKGVWISLAGKVTYDGKTLYFSNPSYERFHSMPDDDLLGFGTHTGRLVAVYPETAKLTSRWLRYIINLILPKILPKIKEFLPEEIKKSQNLLDLQSALKKIHFPENYEDIRKARRRLAFDELFFIQLVVLQQKQKWQKQMAPAIKFNPKLIKNFVNSLPFQLTNAQRKATWEILQDLEKMKPMNRLLEGDVGSGKTIVAAIAALQCIDAGYQVAIMTPTEILAQQHFKTLSSLFTNYDINIALLSSSENKCVVGDLLFQDGSKAVKKITRKEILEEIKIGNIQLVIGTHALIQEKVKFKKLALAIIDEQHRFGVQQRAALQKQISSIDDGLPSTIPHLLSMTATPIPRTLTLTIYGDLDLSLLNEMPKGRQKIVTKIVSPTNRNKAYEFIRQQVKEGRQVFVICPRIESSSKNFNAQAMTDKSLSDWQQEKWNNLAQIKDTNEQIDRRKLIWAEVKAVEEEYEKLSKKIFPDLKIAMLHGKMKPKEKEKIMKDFRDKKYDILVSTSVVEVGVDVPNATVMMVESAERFGLAQLHQFRGRVGRSEHQSYCFLFTESSSRTTRARLNALITAKTGFELAEKDLKIRGPGDFYGTRQWGLPDLTMASLTDVDLIKACRQEAKKLLIKDPTLNNHPLLKEKLNQFQITLHLE